MNIIDSLDLKQIKEAHQKEIEALESLIKRNEALIENNEKLKSETYKDETVSKLKEENERLLNDTKRGFTISENEEEKINKWKTSHIRKKHTDKTTKKPKSFGAIGGNFTYEFIPTSIGTIGSIKCSCGECFTFRDL